MKLWGGRFAKETSHLVEDFHSSIGFDFKLCEDDINLSIAHSKMLESIGILDSKELEQILFGLRQILSEYQEGKIEFTKENEDIHMNIESLLIEKIGDVGKKVHTGRSRNDQVATDLRLYAMREIELIKILLLDFEDTILRISSENIKTIMCGYTHLQKAQPITFAHHLMAYFEMFKRDYERLNDALKRVRINPLGSGALAGTTFPLNREMTSKELGFDTYSLNSLDGVSDRDYVVELTSALSLIMVHLSRLSEEIIFWCSDECRYVTLDDGYSTGSSIMPQKKNPDVAELVRGKTGRVFGNLMSILTVLKGIPLAYNKDMQEDKEGFFDSIDTVKKSLIVFEGMIGTMKINKENLLRSAKSGFTNATDVADYLVKKGVPFRESHKITGELVAKCIMEKKSLDQLSLNEFKEASKYFDNDIYEMIDLNYCVEERKTKGAPSSQSVMEHLEISKNWLKENK